jgi:hypothetical protein
MARYVLVHTPVIEQATQETLYMSLRAIAQASIPDTEWLASWLAVDSSKMFCLWEAPDEDSIRAALGEEIGQMAPIDAVYEAVTIEPSFFLPD